MSLITAENVNQFFGAQQVLRNVSVQISPGDRIGLVGANGEGKTTLLRIIGGMLEPTEGSVHRSRGSTTGFLPQDPPALEGSSIHDAMLEVFADVRKMEGDLHDLAARMDAGEDDPQLLERYGSLQTRFEDLGGYEYPHRIEQVLTGLAFPRDIWDRPLSKLSGGQRTRAYLARLLLCDLDLLMLDEPTNHLDLDSVEWLEGWLRSFRGALLIVSHDRYLLDRTTSATWEIAFSQLETYPAPYRRFLKLREERYTQRLRQWEGQQEYIARTEEFIRRNLSGQRTKEAQGRRTRLERFMRDEAVPRPQHAETIHFVLPPAPRTGDIVLRAQDLVVGYEKDKPLVRAERLDIERGQRVAIVGANGIGKTALLRTMLSEINPLEGHVRLGSNAKVAYLSQAHAELDSDRSALETLTSLGCALPQARDLLGSVRLSGDEALKRIGELSGGQRSRVGLARLMLQRPNVLFVDEPTNHLDIPSTEIVQRALQSFEGTVILVSHDRYLVQSVATHIWAVAEGGIRCILGGWESYLQWRDDLAAQGPADAPTRKKANSDKNRKKADYQEARKQSNLLQRLRRRHEEVVSEVEAAETALAQLSDDISAAGEAGDIQRIEELGKKYEQLDSGLQALWTEWEQLEEQLS
jgi:ATP-binding cassette, subfamily F, member 3